MEDADEWIDDVGTAHPTARGHVRILTLVPSITELLFEMDLWRHIVGRTSYCIHPADGVDLIPSVGGTKKIDMNKARSLHPSHAIVNVDENPKSMADSLRSSGIEVIVTHPIRPMDNVRLFQLMGGIFGRQHEAERLTSEFMAEMARIQTRAGDRHGRRVLYLIWRDPWMTVSRETYISQMLALVGWQTVSPKTTSRYPELELPSGLAGVDVVLLASEPYSFTPADVEAFRAAYPEFGGDLRWIDGEMVSWYGSRSIQGLRYLRAFVARGD